MKSIDIQTTPSLNTLRISANDDGHVNIEASEDPSLTTYYSVWTFNTDPKSLLKIAIFFSDMARAAQKKEEAAQALRLEADLRIAEEAGYEIHKSDLHGFYFYHLADDYASPDYVQRELAIAAAIADMAMTPMQRQTERVAP